MNHLIFDTHAHYNDDAFAEDRDEVLSGLRAHGIGTVVNICSDLESIGETLELMEKYPWIYGAAGIHPTDTAPLNEENFKTVIEALKHPKMENDIAALSKNTVFRFLFIVFSFHSTPILFEFQFQKENRITL